MAWLRVDDGMPEHRKVLRLPRKDRWTWLELLCYVARQNNGGHVPAEVCDVLKWVTPKFVNACLEAGLLDRDNDGFSVHDWDDYNPRDPTAAERMRRYRASRRDATVTPTVTDDDTPPARAGARDPSPTPTPTTQPAAQRPPEDPAPAAAAERLRAAGWTPAQIAAAHNGATNLERALAWLDHAEADPSCREPGALAWTKFHAGTDPPEQRSTLAPGATGTRSTSPHGHPCPHCGITTTGPNALTDHIANIHYDAADPSDAHTKKRRPEPALEPAVAAASGAREPNPEGDPA